MLGTYARVEVRVLSIGRVGRAGVTGWMFGAGADGHGARSERTNAWHCYGTI